MTSLCYNILSSFKQNCNKFPAHHYHSRLTGGLSASVLTSYLILIRPPIIFQPLLLLLPLWKNWTGLNWLLFSFVKFCHSNVNRPLAAWRDRPRQWAIKSLQQLLWNIVTSENFPAGALHGSTPCSAGNFYPPESRPIFLNPEPNHQPCHTKL